MTIIDHQPLPQSTASLVFIIQLPYTITTESPPFLSVCCCIANHQCAHNMVCTMKCILYIVCCIRRLMVCSILDHMAVLDGSSSWKNGAIVYLWLSEKDAKWYAVLNSVQQSIFTGTIGNEWNRVQPGCHDISLALEMLCCPLLSWTTSELILRLYLLQMMYLISALYPNTVQESVTSVKPVS